SCRPRACATARVVSPTSTRGSGWKATLSSPRTCSSTTWLARTPTATSSVGTSPPASDARNSGIAPAITARTSGSPPRSTRPKSPASRPRGNGETSDDADPRRVLSGKRRDRRCRLGVHLSDPVRRAQSRAAHGERFTLRADRSLVADDTKDTTRAGRGNAEGTRGTAQEGQARAALIAHLAGRAELVEKPVHPGCGRARHRCLHAGPDRTGWAAPIARSRLCGVMRPAALAAVIPQEAP